ncbi:MAG: NADPH-dependent oxidoreductase, partial [Acidimicrobiia bacterium]
GVFPVVGFSLGHPAEDPPKRDRLLLDGLVHYETYQDYTEDRIAEIYRDRNQAGRDRYMSIPELRAMVEEYGVENPAQIYTVVKYTKEGHDRYTRNVLDYLKNQDFFRS